MSYSIGSKVRVLHERNGSRQSGTVSLINDENTYDIIYDGNNNEEECGVSLSRLSPVESFELDDLECYTANQLKEFGNVLFRLKDYDAAVNYYRLSLSTLLRPFSFSVGSTVLVQKSPSSYVSGMIADVNDSSDTLLYEVVYDDEQLEDSIEPESRLLLLATTYPDNSSEPTSQTVVPSAAAVVGLSSSSEQSIDPIELQRSIYMNLIRCCLQKPVPTPGWACRYATFAVAITHYNNLHNNSDPEKGRKQLADALYLRCKSFLTASRPQLARIDAIELQTMDPIKATQLLKEIDAFCVKRQKSNRKLAKDVAAWVETAMQIHQSTTSKQVQTNDHINSEEDLDVDFEDEDD